MRRRLLSLVWMTGVWIALWGDLTVANTLRGVAVATIVLLILPPRDLASGITVHPFSVARLGSHFFWQLIKASAIVAWEVVTPINRLKPAVVAVPLRTDSPVLAAIVGNMVSLTPGTLTLEVLGDPPVLYVHVIHLQSNDDVLASIHKLELLATRAFTNVEYQQDQEVE